MVSAPWTGRIGTELFETVTLLRQNGRKALKRSTRTRLCALLLGASLLPLPALADAKRIVEVGLTERVVLDRTSGIALYGYDPVSYFVDAAPRIGTAEFEYIWNGAAWRFANEGNMAAFMKDPTVYSPQFGGYDPVSVARGVPTPGDPTNHLLSDGRVFLFRDSESRAAFLASPEQAAAAQVAWPALEKTLIH